MRILRAAGILLAAALFRDGPAAILLAAMGSFSGRVRRHGNHCGLSGPGRRPNALLFQRKRWRSVLPLFAASALFLVLHMALAPKQATGAYSMHFGAGMIATFAAYWKLAVTPPGIPGIPQWTMNACAIAASASLAGFTLYSAWRRQWLPLFFLCWYAILLAPVLPLRYHISDYYLTLPAMGLGWLQPGPL